MEEAPPTDMQADKHDELADREVAVGHIAHCVVGCSGDVLDATTYWESERTHSVAGIVHYQAMAHQVKVLQC